MNNITFKKINFDDAIVREIGGICVDFETKVK